MDKKITLKELVKREGGVSAFAAKLNVTRQIVYMWLNNNTLPTRSNLKKINTLAGGNIDGSQWLM